MAEQHDLRCYEIGKDGESCDYWLNIDLTRGVGGGLYASDLYLGSNALYVNMGHKSVYKLDII